MEKEIIDMNPKNRSARYLKFFANTENTNINAGSVKEVRYALITSGNLNAKSAEGLKYALTAKENISAKIAPGLKYALTAGKSKPARSAVIRLK